MACHKARSFSCMLYFNKINPVPVDKKKKKKNSWTEFFLFVVGWNGIHLVKSLRRNYSYQISWLEKGSNYWVIESANGLIVKFGSSLHLQMRTNRFGKKSKLVRRQVWLGSWDDEVSRVAQFHQGYVDITTVKNSQSQSSWWPTCVSAWAGAFLLLV